MRLLFRFAKRHKFTLQQLRQQSAKIKIMSEAKDGSNGNDRLINLMMEIKDSLEREIHAVGSAVGSKVDNLSTRFDNQAARLDRQAAMMQTGNRWISRINDWSEKLDAAIEVKDREIAELRVRIEAIEKSQGVPPATPPSTQ